jgi:transcription antitermination protein NusB
MGARSSGREAALQMLYALEAASHSPERAIRDFWREFPGDAEGRPYADDLLPKIWTERELLDQHISQACNNWRLDRMTRVDRNILRLAAYELIFEASTPAPVILDEAVELAKQYGADNSASFVNGVLANLLQKARPAGETTPSKGGGSA